MTRVRVFVTGDCRAVSGAGRARSAEKRFVFRLFRDQRE